MDSTIVIAEDDRELQKIYSDYLTTDFQVNVFDNGSEILNFFRNGAFVDLIITDINMPVMNGLSVVQYFRKQLPVISHIPVLVVTAMDDERILKKSKELGANDIILKPFQLPDLKARIDKKLRKKLKIDELASLLKRCNMPTYRACHGSASGGSQFEDPKEFLLVEGNQGQFRILINRGHSIQIFSEEHLELHMKNIEVYYRNDRANSWQCIWPTYISQDLFFRL